MSEPTLDAHSPDPSIPRARTRLESDVCDTVAMLSKWLPEQRPLGVFVHLNPLGAIESHHFHAGCEAATRIRGARTTFTAARYRELLATKQLRSEDVAAAQKRLASLDLTRIDVLPRPGAGTILLSTVRPEMAVEVGEMVDAFLLRILPAFLDLGSAIFPMPGREQGLLGVLRRLAALPLGVPEPWLGGLRALLGKDTPALSIVTGCLEKRGDATTGWPNIIHDAMFALPGYTGMIHRLEHHPEERPPGTKVVLLDYLAARLAVEELALLEVARRLFGRKATLATLGSSLPPTRRAPAASWSEELAAFQDAYEEEYVRSFVGAVATFNELERPEPAPADVHYVTCIDDRLESIRRHLEEVVPRCETVGAAGFFGVAIKHRSPLSSDETPSCPAPVTPERRVTEVLPEGEASVLARTRRAARAFHASLGDDASRRPLGGFLASFANVVRAPQMLSHLLFPAAFVKPATDFEGTKLVFAREDDPQGFTLEEQASHVERLLKSIGVVRFGRWVLIVAHGSMGVNNPFLSGYQCGACGGQRGGINARVFCTFANAPAVRELLTERGFEIPAETIFVPGEHDTALDVIRFFEVDALPAKRRDELEELKKNVDRALERNTQERARRFADIPLGLPAAETVARVRRRCVDFAETRPEYNHATNATCIIGRRSLSRGLFLDRRAFLTSYDPTLDDENASILERMLAAPLPVCAGISHEYFFSTMDPQRFGCGTKLPHNVQGLVGVSNGADGDLRPGLWAQTTEIHDPIRLVTIIEAEPEVIERTLERLPAVKDTIANDWIHTFALSPSGRGFFRWVGRGFTPYLPVPQALFDVGSSLEACVHTRDSVAPCTVGLGHLAPGAHGKERAA